MSKAFTKEDDEYSEPDRPDPVLPQGKNYVTPTGFATLQNELRDLMSNQRPEVVKVVSWAASNGDRSENGDYIYGGGKTDTAPLAANSLSALASLPSTAAAFANGDIKKSVQVGDGTTFSTTYNFTTFADTSQGACRTPQCLSANGFGTAAKLNMEVQMSMQWLIHVLVVWQQMCMQAVHTLCARHTESEWCPQADSTQA